MTEGNIVKHLLWFAFPLLIGNIFQQLYNTVDTYVIGQYGSNAAYSAVGTVGPIINMLIGFFMGLASGAGVVISQYFGAKKYDRVKEAVHTSLVMTVFLGVLFTVVGILFVPVALKMMNTPADVYPEQSAYLTIYFGGVLGLMIYNMGAGILRAVGDSERPFLFLVVSAILNIALDLLFVVKFGLGVKGVALATVISQGVSAVLVLLTLWRSRSCIRLSFRDLRVCPPILKKIVRVGIPAALQMALTAFSNIFVQSYINQFGTACMGGWTSYAKIDQLLLLPMQSLALASTTFVGQNLGKKQVDRARKGVRSALLMSVFSVVVLMVPVMIFAPQIVGFFRSEEEVVYYGALLLRAITPFYVLCCFNQIYAGALRGAGNSRAPMVIMLLAFVLFRQVYLFVMSNFICNEIIPIAMGYPAGWLICSTATLIYYRHADLGKNRLVDEPDTPEA